jgi:hypothetical protein
VDRNASEKSDTDHASNKFLGSDLGEMMKPTKLTKLEIDAGILRKVHRSSLNGFVLCYVEAGMIVYDDHQRDLDDSHEREIQQEFNPQYVQIPYGTFRNDGIEVGWRVYGEDGHHRTDAVIQQRKTFKYKGKDCVEIFVHFEMDGKAAARFFAVSNTSPKKVNEWCSFKAGVKGELKTDLAIFNLFKKNKLTTPLDPKTKGKQPDMKHIAAYKKVFNAHKEVFFSEYCKLHARCLKEFPHTCGFFKGLISFICKKSIFPMVLAEFLDPDTLASIKEKAADLGRQGGRGEDKYGRAIDCVLDRNPRFRFMMQQRRRAA